MSGAWERISETIGLVRDLEITPIAAINRIDDILIEAAVKEAPLYPKPAASRFQLALLLGVVILALISAGATGWAIRGRTSNDRYINSLAEQHEAAARYYNERTDQIITTPQPKKGPKQQ